MDLASVVKETRNHALEDAAALVEALAYEMTLWTQSSIGYATHQLAERIRALKAEEPHE